MLFTSSFLRAQPGGERPGVMLEVDACTGVPAEVVRRFVAIELGAFPVDPASGSGRETTRISAGCTADAVRLGVEDPVTGKTVVRHIDLAADPALTRPRLLALAISELVTASWAELAVNPRPVVRPLGATASAEARRLASGAVALQAAQGQPASRYQVLLVGARRAFTVGGLAALGGGLAIERTAGRRWAWAADLLIESDQAVTSLGGVHALLTSASAVLLRRVDSGFVTLAAGLGARLGIARLAGEAAPADGVEGATVFGPWGGPMAAARLSLRIQERVSVALAAEAGMVALEVGGRVAGLPEVSVEGAWFSVAAGIGISL